MHKFMNPSSIALLGTPRKTGLGAFNNAEMMLRYGFKGRIYPVNPAGGEVLGLKMYTAVSEIPETVDLAIISVGRDRVMAAFEDCIRSRIRHMIIISQGFADADEHGRKLQEAVVWRARESGVRVMGPNTLGVVNNYRHLNTAFVEIPFPERFLPVSLIAQTGFIQVAARNLAWRDIGKAIDVGNSCDIDTVDALNYLENDPETEVIVIHMEGLKRGPEFLEAAGRVSRKKPVIVLKTGRSKAGARAALSHSGSLVGEDHVYDAAFKRAGILRVRTSGDMRDAIHALVVLGEMKGPRLGVVTVTGAGGIMCADACEDAGLTLGELPTGLREKLTMGVPDWIRVSNPVDIWPIGMLGNRYIEAFKLSLVELLKSPEIDGVMAILFATSSPLHSDLSLYDAFAEARHEVGNLKPFAIWPYLESTAAVDRFEAIPGIACFDSIEQAVKGLSYCHQYYRLKNRPRTAPRTFAIDEASAGTLAAKGKKEGMLLGQEALQLLEIYGIPAAAGAEAKSLVALRTAAKNMTPPYVLKLSGCAFLHKSEWGGIVTGIESLRALRPARIRLIENVRNRDPDVHIEAFQIQEQLVGKEIIMGLTRDSVFGHFIACGQGGIYTEVFRDVSHEIVPVDEATARSMIESLRIWPILEGTRGEHGVDIDSLVEIVERLSFFALRNPDVAELDINPLMASTTGCRAVDARIIWG
ncbi:MAG: acetate--CoA ligase family protein [Syntrophus sp. (in: bacteria)]